jgi:GTP-binding protein HflX
MSDDFEDADRRSGPEPFVDQREQPTRVGLICPDLRGQPARHSIEARQGEFEGLAKAIRVEVVFSEVVNVRDIRPATFLGSGTVESIARKVAEGDVELLLFDAALSPVQQRNLETQTKAKVLDRTGLILEIFGERAATREGVLQVELAHLNYQKGRLVRSWTHLERQRGGFGFLGGPGESQLEIDRRLIGERIAKLRSEIEDVKRTRALHRTARKRVPYPVIALVGYTNAGKSTLFNRLTRAEVDAKDLLFATLDPTMRQLRLPSGRRTILSDTVGFISDLPTQLVAAFRATLEEVTEADLVLHVRDIHHPESEAQRQDVHAVLGELGLSRMVEEGLVEILNKVDLLPEAERLRLAARAQRNEDCVPVSAATGEGCQELLALLDRRFDSGRQAVELAVPLSDGAAIAWLYAHGEVVERRDDETRAHLAVRLSPADLGRFKHRAPLR